MNGIGKQMPFFVEEPEIHAPGIDPDGGNVSVVSLCTGAQRHFYLVENTQNIPGKLSGNHNGLIGKAMIFF